VRTKQNEALRTALRLITRRDRTESEMRDRLQKKGFSEKDINETIQYLKQKGFIDDSKFIKSAEKIAEDRFLGEMGLRNYLSKKGIDRELLINLPQLDEFSIAKRLLERKKHFLKDSAPDKKKSKDSGISSQKRIFMGYCK